ncbi:hypothetical protein [Sagittula stellata]|uniref:hypothetical protein n=2 Tax=Sagittula stellata TaxID=52603 RepID=UPI0018DE4A5A|nr:hypothetical protein [Sagittula stellata]
MLAKDSMKLAVVVEGNPVTDDVHRVLVAFEAVAMRALPFERPDEALDHAVWRAGSAW